MPCHGGTTLGKYSVYNSWTMYLGLFGRFIVKSDLMVAKFLRQCIRMAITTSMMQSSAVFYISRYLTSMYSIVMQVAHRFFGRIMDSVAFKYK